MTTRKSDWRESSCVVDRAARQQQWKLMAESGGGNVPVHPLHRNKRASLLGGGGVAGLMPLSSSPLSVTPLSSKLSFGKFSGSRVGGGAGAPQTSAQAVVDDDRAIADAMEARMVMTSKAAPPGRAKKSHPLHASLPLQITSGAGGAAFADEDSKKSSSQCTPQNCCKCITVILVIVVVYKLIKWGLGGAGGGADSRLVTGQFTPRSSRTSIATPLTLPPPLKASTANTSFMPNVGSSNYAPPSVMNVLFGNS